MSSPFKLSDLTRTLQVITKGAPRTAEVIEQTQKPAGNPEIDVLAESLMSHFLPIEDNLDIYPGSLLTVSVNHLQDEDAVANSNSDSDFNAVVKEFSSFARLFLNVQLTNIASGAEITAAIKDAQDLLTSAQADFAQYLKLNAEIKAKTAELNNKIRDDELRAAYKDMAEKLLDAAKLQEAIAIATITAGAALFAAGAATAWLFGAGVPLMVAGAALIATGTLQLVDAEAKKGAANAMLAMCNDPNQPIDEVAMRALANQAQQGLSGQTWFKVVNFVAAVASAVLTFGANVNSVLTVIGFVAELADIIASATSDSYSNAKPSDNDDLTRTKKAVNYLKKLTGGVGGAVNIALEAILKDVVIRLAYGMGSDDTRSPAEKRNWEIVIAALEMLTSFIVAGATMKANQVPDGPKTSSLNQTLFGGAFMNKFVTRPLSDLSKTGDVEKLQQFWQAAMTVKTTLGIVQSISNAVNEFKLAAVDGSKAALNMILTKLKSALELLTKLNALKDQLTQDQQKMLEEQQSSLAAEITDLIKNIQGMLDNMNTGISNTNY